MCGVGVCVCMCECVVCVCVHVGVWYVHGLCMSVLVCVRCV